MSFSESDKTKILRLKSSIASYYNLQMKKIGDKHLESFLFNHGVISGGMICSLFHDEAVADIDVYAKDNVGLIAIKDYILSKDKNIKSTEAYEIDSEGNKKFKDGSAQKWVTTNAVTLTNDVQFIYMDTWQNAQSKFDFVHCMPYYDIGTQKLYISESQYLAIKTKTLILTGKSQASDKRIQKYMKRGWTLQNPASTTSQWNGVIAQEVSKMFPDLYINIPT